MLPETNLNQHFTPNGNGHDAGGLPFVLAPSRPLTVMEIVAAVDQVADALYDAIAEFEGAIECLEPGSAELRRRTGRKRARDARHRSRKRARSAS